MMGGYWVGSTHWVLGGVKPATHTEERYWIPTKVDIEKNVTAFELD